jgi:Tol biopolymer transport system component
MYFLSALILFVCFSCGGSPKTDAETEVLSETEAASSERIAELKENVADEPNNLSWRLQLAHEYEAMGQNMEALKTYEQALQIDPNQSDIKYSYAELSSKMGEKRKAFSAYKEILLGRDGSQYLNRIAPKFLDTYNVKPIVSTSIPEAYANYSEDGSKIIYQAYNIDNWNIWEYDNNTQMTRQLTFDSADEENPDYSASQQLIAYTSTKDDHRDVDFNQKLRDIYTTDLKAQYVTNLTTNGSNDWKPRFSADGKLIVFVSERSDLRNVNLTELYSHIFIMEIDGSFQLELTKVDANDGGPVLLGGETGMIYFDSNRAGSFDIYRMKADGKEVKQITYGRDYNNAAPDINSDGTKITFFSDRDGNYEIYLMNENGDNEERITSNPADDLNPVFSPDGRRIMFHSNRSGNFDIYEVFLDQKSAGATISDVIAKIDASLTTM